MVPQNSFIGNYSVDWSANGWAIVGLIVGAVGAAFSGGVYWHLDDFKKRLRDEQAIRLDAAKALKAPKPWNAYLQTLETALDTVTRWMGRRARLRAKGGDHGDWGKSANWCFTLAMNYPLAFLLVSWLLGGTGTIGDVTFLPPPKDTPGLQRAFLALLLLAMGIGFYFFGRKWDQINELINTWLNQRLWHHLLADHRSMGKILQKSIIGVLLFLIFYIGFDAPLAGALVTASALALAGAVAVALTATVALATAGAMALGGAGAIALAGVAALAGIVSSAIAGTGARASAGALAVASAVAAATATALAVALVGGLALAFALVMSGGISAPSLNATFLLFFVLLPFVNALFDWTSWQVSRWLGDNLLTISRDQETPAWWRAIRYVGDMICDIVVALACLLGLAWAVPRVINAFNSLIQWFTGESIIAIGAYLCAAAREPLGDGFWATSMLFSTLFPTAIHLALLFVAPLIWLLTPGETSRARASHLTHGTRPPPIDIRGSQASAEMTWPEPTPKDYGTQALREDQDVFEGPLHQTTLHAITIQLRFKRPLLYAVGLAVIGVALYWLGGLAFSSWRPLPEFLLWIAHNFDYAAVRECFPTAAPTAPFETLAI